MSVSRGCAARAVLLASLLYCCPTLAVPVVPGDFAELEGESNNVIPFSNLFGMAYQQVYDGAAFGGNSGAIDAISFRLDAGQAPGYSVSGQVNLSVKLGASARSSQSVSTVFAENRAGEPVEVFNGIVSFALADLPGGVPNPFDLRIDLQRSFAFNGMQDLLLELNLLQPIITTDAFGVVLDAAVGPFGRSFATATGNLANPGFGLVTQFNITPASIAEPSALALCLLGLVLMIRCGTIQRTWAGFLA